MEPKLTLKPRPQIAEAAVVGIPSEGWGQKVAALIVLNPDPAPSTTKSQKWGVMDLRRALAIKLAKHKLPQEVRIVKDALPRNAMGKGEDSTKLAQNSIVLTKCDNTVNKKALTEAYFSK